MEILVSVINQEMRLATNLRNYAFGSKNFVRFRYDLDESWNGLLTFAQFSQGGRGYNLYLDEEKCVYLPAELTVGKCNMVLCGTNGTSIVATTNTMELTINDNMLVEGSESTDITPTLYEQLVAQVESVRALVGSPLIAETAADMTDTSRVYVYTGGETGYNFGHWYYYLEPSWRDAGVYNSDGFNLDNTLSVPGLPADSAAVGSALDTKQDELTFDTEPTEDSDNPVTSGGVYDALAMKQDALIFDTEPTEDSDNPVTSGGVKAAIDNITIEVDDTLSIEGMAADAAATGSAISALESGKQGVLTFDTVPTEDSTNPVTSGGIKAALDGKQDALTIDNVPVTGSTNPVSSGGVKAALGTKQDTLTFDTVPTSGSYNPVTSGGVKAALDNMTVEVDPTLSVAGMAADAKAVGDAIIAANNRMQTIENTIHGVSDMALRWYPSTNSVYANGTPHSPAVNGYATTEVTKMPKSGIYIYSNNLIGFKVHFWNLNNGQYVPATGYPYYWGDTSTPEQLRQYARYYSYAENLYFTITVYVSGGVNLDSVRENLHCVCGSISDSGGRLPNLFQITMFIKHANGVIDQQALVFNRSYSTTSNINSRAKFYGSILRTQDVDRIVFAPPYSGVARIYRLDNDNKQIVPVEEIFAPVTNPGGTSTQTDKVTGVHVIDVTKYDFDGFIMLGVVPEVNEVLLQTNSIWYQLTYNGMLRKYNDAYNHIYVEWKPGISVTYDSEGVPAIAKSNINTIMNYNFAPDLQASLSDGGFGSWISDADPIGFGAYGRCFGWWYNGGYHYNCPHMHVTPKSYITASKNRHSRVYVPTFPGYTTKNNMYGATCVTITGLVCGVPVSAGSISTSSKLVSGYQYRDYTDIEDIRPGDTLSISTLTPDSEDLGHSVYITEAVRINGETYCVNLFEGYPPWTAFRTIINFDALTDYTVQAYKGNSMDYFTFCTTRYIEKYLSKPTSEEGREIPDWQPGVVLMRKDPKDYRTIRDAYGPYDVQDYDVTEIMCDRGTDSVYCIDEYMTLTVTDGTTEIELRNVSNSTSDVIDLSLYPSVSYADGIVYNVTGIVSDFGYHEIYANGEKKESFYVPPTREVHLTNVDSQTHKVTFTPSEPDDKVIAVAVYYKQTYYDDSTTYWPDKYKPVVPHYDIDENTIVEGDLWRYDFPRFCTFHDGIQRRVQEVRVIRKTPYGVYTSRRAFPASSAPPGTEGPFNQKAGILYDPSPALGGGEE